jgi:hypothetical protein
MDLRPKEKEIQTWFSLMETNINERVCPNCGESCENEYETVFVNGQELCVCCNSNIEPCYEEDGFTDDLSDNAGGNNNVFVDIYQELHHSYNPLD